MSLVRDDLPYSKKGLEDLAAALRIDSAYLWVNPVNSRLEVIDKSSGHSAKKAKQVLIDEDEIDESV